MAFRVIVFVAILAPEASSLTWVENGMQMTSTAFEAVCWYENLKNFPQTNTAAFRKCTGQVAFLIPQLKTDQEALDYFGKWMGDPMATLPTAYDTECQKYRNDAKAEPAKDEGDVLRDNNRNRLYPFKALAYCLMSQLRKRHGTKALEAVKNERTYNIKDWRETLLARDNEFRARHGVPPFRLENDLNYAAQKWAEKNANQCFMEHSDTESPPPQWNGQSTGESIARGSSASAEELHEKILAFSCNRSPLSISGQVGFIGRGYVVG